MATVKELKHTITISFSFIKVIKRLNEHKNCFWQLVICLSLTVQAFTFFLQAFCFQDLQGRLSWTVTGQSVVINYKKTKLTLGDWKEKLSLKRQLQISLTSQASVTELSTLPNMQ